LNPRIPTEQDLKSSNKEKQIHRSNFIYLINKDDLQLFIKHKASTTRSGWHETYQRYLRRYLNRLNWKVSFISTLDYFNEIKPKYSSKTYRDNVLCIRDFLRFHGIEWASNIKLPKAKMKLPAIVKEDQLHTFLGVLNEFESSKEPREIKEQRLRAFLILGAVSGMRAHELYNLTPEQIDFETRSIKLENTKTDEPRYAFFSREAQKELEMLLAMKPSLPLLPERVIQKAFTALKYKTGNLQAKNLRKFFSSMSDKLGMPSGVKKRLMGHSINGDIDLQHYSVLTFDDLKEIYDRYWNNVRIGLKRKNS
jgi:integrase/recombinase XerD